jgi:hypothetical protein
MNLRAFLAAVLPPLTTCFHAASALAQPLIPKPDWLVPASQLIVIAETIEQRSLTTSTARMSAPKSKNPFQNASVVISKVHVSKIILGDPPAEPIIVTSANALSSESDPGITKGSMLLFLAPLDSSALAYKVIRGLPIEKDSVPWVSKTSQLRMSPTPIAEVVTQLEQFIKLHPSKPADTSKLPSPSDLSPPPGSHLQ